MKLKRSNWLKQRFSPSVPPTLPTLTTLSLTALSFLENVTEGSPIASIVGKTVGSELTIEQAGSWFTISGTQLLKGPAATPDGGYPITIVETLAGATGSPKDNNFELTAIAVTPVGSSNFGAKTRSGHGGVPSNNIPDSVITGLGAADWRIDAEGDLVPSGTYGAFKTFTRSSYTLTLSNGDVALITIQPNKAHVKWKNNASLPNVDTSSAFQLRTLTSLAQGTSGALVFGDEILVRPGIQNNISTGSLGGLSMRLRPPLNGYAGSGWLKITAEVPVDLDDQAPGVCQISNLGFDSALMTSGTLDVGFEISGFQCMRPGTKTAGCFSAADTNGRRLSRFWFHDNRFWGGVINSELGLDISSGIYMPTTADNVSIEDNVFHDLFNPFQIGGTAPIVRNNILVRAYNDFIKLAAPTGSIRDNNIQIDKRIPVGIGAHGDYDQEAHGGRPVATNFQGSIVTRHFSVTGQTAPLYNQDGAIVFADDPPVDSKMEDVSFSQVFGLNRQKNNAVLAANPLNGQFSCITAIYEPDSTTGAAVLMRGAVDSNIDRAYASSISHSEYTPGAGGGTVFPSNSTITNSVAFNPTLAFNWATIAAKHAVAFRSPSYGAANGYPATEVPTRSAVLALVATIKENWSPKPGVLVADGGCMLPDGSYVGAFFPRNTDGSVDWNDGSIYVPH